MTVYGEYLFLENFLAGWFLLALTQKLCGPGRESEKGTAEPGGGGRGRRLWLAAAACGLFSFTLFLQNLPGWAGLLLKLGFARAVTVFCFGRGNWRHTGIFLLMSLAFGGIVLGSLFLCQSPGYTYGTGFYIGPLRYGQVVPVMIGGSLALWAFASRMERRRLQKACRCWVKVRAGGRTLRLSGFLDTGNGLRDPLTGRPVFLLQEGAAAEFLQGRRKDLCRPLPCRPMGGEVLLLDAFDPEGIWIFCPEEGCKQKGERWQPVTGVLAIAPGALPGGCDVLLPPVEISPNGDEREKPHRLFAMESSERIVNERCD